MFLKPTEDEIILLKSMDNLPPHWWLDCCDTPDRKMIFNKVRYIYSQTKILLQQYFSGATPKLDCQDKMLANIIKDRAKEYRLLYALVFDAWDYLTEDFEVLDRFLFQSRNLRGLKDLELTPGKFIFLVFEEDSEQMLKDIAFPELVTGNNIAEFGFHRTREMSKKYNEIIRELIIKKLPENLPKSLQDRATKEMKQHRSNYLLRIICDGLLERAADKDADIKKSLKQLNEFIAERVRTSTASLHPDRLKHYPVISHTLKNGVITNKGYRREKNVTNA
jgi:hypothetical protein